jgi:hypothetical protein
VSGLVHFSAELKGLAILLVRLIYCGRLSVDQARRSGSSSDEVAVCAAASSTLKNGFGVYPARVPRRIQLIFGRAKSQEVHSDSKWTDLMVKAL